MVRPESNFDFVDERFSDLLPLKRVLSVVRQHGERTIVVEKLGPSKDLQQENEDLRRFCTKSSEQRFL